jgi:4-hydroxy-tetrahydrodipicolinate synthase
MFDDIKERLEGCVYTIFTPFGPDQNIDYEALDKYITHLYRTGARKFYVMAYNSRYGLLRHAEIMELNAHCIKTVKTLDKNNLIIVGDPITCSTAETIEFTRHAKEHGADLASLIFSEKHYCDEQVVEHYAQVGRETGMAILVHEMQFLSGFNGKQMHWPASLFKSLPKVPEIVALKEDAKDFDVTCTALSLEPRIRIVISGLKGALMKYRPHGVRAYLNGISMLDARIGERFWKAFTAHDDATTTAIIEKLEAPFFTSSAAKFGWHRVNKAFLQAAGFMHRRDRMPLMHLNDEEYKLVEADYAKVAVAVREFLGA